METSAPTTPYTSPAYFIYAQAIQIHSGFWLAANARMKQTINKYTRNLIFTPSLTCADGENPVENYAAFRE